MVLKNILKTTNFKDIYSEILKLYPNEKNTPMENYKKVFLTLNQLFTTISNIELTITEEEHLILKGIAKPNNNTIYVQSKSWSEWLGMSLSKDFALKYTKEEVVAICLYNITYLGYTEKNIIESIHTHKRNNSNRPNITIDDITKDIFKQ